MSRLSAQTEQCRSGVPGDRGETTTRRSERDACSPAGPCGRPGIAAALGVVRPLPALPGARGPHGPSPSDRGGDEGEEPGIRSLRGGNRHLMVYSVPTKHTDETFVYSDKGSRSVRRRLRGRGKIRSRRPVRRPSRRCWPESPAGAVATVVVAPFPVSARPGVGGGRPATWSGLNGGGPSPQGQDGRPRGAGRFGALSSRTRHGDGHLVETLQMDKSIVCPGQRPVTGGTSEATAG